MESLELWVGCNRDGSISLHTVKPERDNGIGKWISKRPFCCPPIQENFEKTFKNTDFTWKNEAEVLLVSVNGQFWG